MALLLSAYGRGGMLAVRLTHQACRQTDAHAPNARACHMAKGLEKFTSRVGFLSHAWAEPSGVQTAIQMNAKAIPQPAAWFALPTLSALAMLLLGTGILLAWREARLTDPVKGARRVAPILLLGGFYFFLVFGWGDWVQ